MEGLVRYLISKGLDESFLSNQYRTVLAEHRGWIMLSSRIKQAKGFLAFLIGMMFILFINQVAYTQGFGKNKVQYRTFDWKFIQSDHFDVYYYDDAKEVAIFTADVAESSYVALKKDFKYKVTNRIPILIYNGHNEFQQTNVTLSDLSESVGGFTEVFKDRVVIPFQGSYKEYRHVLHHELTHAVMFQMFYGGGMGATITGMARFQVPLWLAEGLAEYESLGWDTDSDMYMRDAAINGYVPPIEYMYGFMVYKGGQSVLNYIADKYGEQKIGEILGKVRLSRNVNQGIKQSIGIDLEELSERWHKHLRKTYWPDVENRHEPEDLAKRLTDHEKNEHFLNGSPSVSPKGDRIAYLSDRSNYTDIYLMSTVDGRNLGRLVKGQRSNLFEEMHWLRPGMSWSPDGKQLVFAAKASNMSMTEALFPLTNSTWMVFILRPGLRTGIQSRLWVSKARNPTSIYFTSNRRNSKDSRMIFSAIWIRTGLRTDRRLFLSLTGRIFSVRHRPVLKCMNTILNKWIYITSM